MNTSSHSGKEPADNSVESYMIEGVIKAAERLSVGNSIINIKDEIIVRQKRPYQRSKFRAANSTQALVANFKLESTRAAAAGEEIRNSKNSFGGGRRGG